MALRKPQPADLANHDGGGTATAVAEPPPVVAGESADECAAIGQALVQGGYLAADALESVLAEGQGDLLRFGGRLLNHVGVDRKAYSQAVAHVCQVPIADASSIQLDEEIVTRFPEDVARSNKVMPIGEEGGMIVLFAADPSPWRRQQVESATGQRFVWKASDDKTVTSFIEQMYLSLIHI